MRLSKKALEILARGREWEHKGGFYTADRSEHQVIERLREKGLLRFWNGRRSKFWQAQFYDITLAGRAAHTAGQPLPGGE
jgi:hypothetical protein